MVVVYAEHVIRIGGEMKLIPKFRRGIHFESGYLADWRRDGMITLIWFLQRMEGESIGSGSYVMCGFYHVKISNE
jgi:hypothetical protein